MTLFVIHRPKTHDPIEFLSASLKNVFRKFYLEVKAGVFLTLIA